MTVRKITEAKPPWQRGLLVNAKGAPKRNIANVMHVLTTHPAWEGVIAYDAFAETVVKLKAPPVRELDRPERIGPGDWTETDSTRAAAWLQHVADLDVSPETVTQAVIALAERRTFHPVREWLQSLSWDRTPRLDGLLARYFGADETAYTRAVGARWAISAVARVMEPGCQADCMLVLEGDQGRRKSTGFERLAGKDWFADTPLDLGSKDAYQVLRRKWIYEVAELDSFKGRDVTKIKAFISARADNYRPSYARKNRDFLRQVVLCGTTNEGEYLHDRTGNRRFWPARSRGDVEVEAIARDREQLWAEAHARYLAGERWYIDTPELRALCEAEQAERVPEDAWVPLVRAWLVHPTVPERGEGRRLLALSEGITTADVLVGALALKATEATAAATQHAGRVLRDLRLMRRQVRVGPRSADSKEWRYFRSPANEEPGDHTVTTEKDERGSGNQVTNVTDASTHTQETGYLFHDHTQAWAGDHGDPVTTEDIERAAIQSERSSE